MRRWVGAVSIAAVAAVAGVTAQTPAASRGVRVEVSFPASVHAGPVTGRVYVMVSRTNDREPRLQIGRTGTPFFGRDVEKLAPGQSAIIDVTGLGAGVYDRLVEVHARPLGYVGAGKTSRRDRSGKLGFTNVRSAAYWNLRELLDPGYEPSLALPPDDLMISDLTSPRWEITSGTPPKIKIEIKEDVVARLGRSPDRGDAVAMVMWAEHHRGTSNVTEPVGHMPTTGLTPLGRP